MARGALCPCCVTDAEAEAAEGAYETIVVGRSYHRVAAVEVDCEGCAPSLVLDVQLRHRAWHPGVVLHVALDSVACGKQGRYGRPEPPPERLIGRGWLRLGATWSYPISGAPAGRRLSLPVLHMEDRPQ